jgi:hypothetical protein
MCAIIRSRLVKLSIKFGFHFYLKYFAYDFHLMKWKWSELRWSEVSCVEVLGDKSTMHIRVTLFWGCLIVLWLLHLVCILYCGCVNLFSNMRVCVFVGVLTIVWVCVCVGLVMCECVCVCLGLWLRVCVSVWVLYCVGVCMGGFCNVWVCVCVCVCVCVYVCVW